MAAKNVRIARLVACGASLAAIVACAFVDDEPIGSAVESGGGVFNYVCVTWGDPACDDSSADEPGLGSGADELFLPERFAVGSRFDARYTRTRSQVLASSASSTLLGRNANGFIAERPGLVALYSTDATGRVEAWRHVPIVQAAGIALNGLDDTTLVVGQEVSVGAQLVDADGQRLGGAVGFTWFTDTPEVLQVNVGRAFNPGTDNDDVAVLAPLSAGDATVRIEAAGVSLEFTVTVQAFPEDSVEEGEQ
jgi:hypothetical protein